MSEEISEPLDHIPPEGIIFGAVQTKLVRTSAPGKLTLHVCLGEFVRADLEHEGKTRCFFVVDKGSHRELCLEHPPGCHYLPAP